MSVFGVCWLPYQVAILYNEHRDDQHLPVLSSSSLTARLIYEHHSLLLYPAGCIGAAECICAV